MAALEADHDIGLFGQPIDDLAFAFVAPLRSDDNYIRHSVTSLPRAARTQTHNRVPSVPKVRFR